MVKISSGAVEPENIVAVLKEGPNYVLHLSTGARVVVSEADAQVLMGEAPKGK
jgi:hypothetical protein